MEKPKMKRLQKNKTIMANSPKDQKLKMQELAKA